MKKRKVITLCGSTKNEALFHELNSKLTLTGMVVFSCGVFVHTRSAKLSYPQKQMLDQIHFDKIRMSDAIYVINLGGYIGDSTRKEITFAEAEGKEIHYHEPIIEPTA